MLIHELSPVPAAVDVFVKLAHLPHCLFLDSAMKHDELGRYSFVAADPFQVIEANASDVDPLSTLQQILSRFSSERVEGLPPFQGGAAGLLSYELGRTLEEVPSAAFDEFEVPRMMMGLYDVVVAFDHTAGRAWVLSRGISSTSLDFDPQVAERRLKFFLERLSASAPTASSVVAMRKQVSSPSELPTGLCAQHAVAEVPDLTSDFSADGYRNAVDRAVEYIRAGDVFQVNLSQRLLHRQATDSISLYLRLRERNPATFAGFFDLGAFQVVSASPERFVKIDNRHVEARPIKGTRRRVLRPEADLLAGDELLESEKDRAENIMILDLLRNDLSIVCRDETIHVPDLCRLEVYQYVQHLVSVVRGELRSDCSAIDVIRAAFPGGSITGAPKVRAMEIIAELEPTARGAYCGSLGYVGFDGAMDLSILIRTITAGRGWWQIPVGGGIVAQSKPQAEYEETWHKAKGMLEALGEQA